MTLDAATPPADTASTAFEAQRRRLLRIAYRMLGSMAEAEDILQEAWIRWQRSEYQEVREPAAFLARIVTRLCLDFMKSARARRETYFGAWLPEPILEPDDHAPAPGELTLPLMLALERLSPLERAAFLLHDVFDVPLAEVAETLERDPAAIRQLAARARQHLRDARPRYTLAREAGDRIAEAFFTASRSGDTAALRRLLAQDVVLRSDGGGKVPAFPNPILGRDRLLRLFEGLARKHAPGPLPRRHAAWIDGLPGFVSRERGDVLQTTALQIEDGRITAIYITRNPDKLRRIVLALGDALPAPEAPPEA